MKKQRVCTENGKGNSSGGRDSRIASAYPSLGDCGKWKTFERCIKFKILAPAQFPIIL